MLQQLADSFRKSSDAHIASKQEAYMKNRFPFFGLKAPERREIQKEVFKKYPIETEKELIEVVFSLYHEKEREFHYAAIDLCHQYRKWVSQLNFIEQLITTHSWWDSVDLISSNLLGFYLSQAPKELEMVDKWIRNKNLWKRRSALIFQLRWKEKTNIKKLFSYCVQCGDEREFFIEKAIGRALRELSKTFPQVVDEFVVENNQLFSPFTKKEACKLIS